MALHIDLEEIEGRIFLRLEGRIDAATSPLLERKLHQLVEEGHVQLFLDFLRIDYLSSAGMRVLLSGMKKAKGKGGRLILFSVSEEVGEIIKMAGFDKILQICLNEKEALRLHA